MGCTSACRRGGCAIGRRDEGSHKGHREHRGEEMKNCFLCVLCVLCVLCGSLFSAESAAGQFVVHLDAPAGPPIVGFGAQLNPYVYCTPNWGDVNEENVKEYERKVIDLAPQHV